MQADGTVATAKALAINASFERSLEFWSSLQRKGRLNTSDFLRQAAHISAVWTPENIAFLKQRYASSSSCQPCIDALERRSLGTAEWMPLVMEGRDPQQAVAATRIARGTDVDFGALTRAYLLPLQQSGALELRYGTQVRTSAPASR